MRTFEIFTDGGANPNPGPGAWAFVVNEGGRNIHQNSGFITNCTNNIAELTAVISALNWVISQDPGVRVYINTDSQYIQLGITKWISGWKRKGWRNSNRKQIANKELWQKLDELTRQVDVYFQWVRGHSENHWNNLADKLCTKTIEDNMVG